MKNNPPKKKKKVTPSQEEFDTEQLAKLGIFPEDDEEIINVAKQYNCEVPFIRPKELAKDTTPGIDPIIHAIEELPGYDYVVLLQPTSPLRKVEDIDGSIEKCVNNQFNYCVTVTEADKNPYWMYTIEKNYKMYPILDGKNLITRRQDSPKVFALNGAVYVANIKKLTEHRSFLNKDTVPYIMPKERSVDIDTEFDLKLVDLLLKNGLFHQ